MPATLQKPISFSSARLETRISSDLHAMLNRAAKIQGRTMTVLSCLLYKIQHRKPSSRPESSDCHWLSGMLCVLLSLPTSALKRAFATPQKTIEL
jgi:hypothetical protein